MIYSKGEYVTASKTDSRKGITEGKEYKVTDSDMFGVKIKNDVGTIWRISYSLIKPYVERGSTDLASGMTLLFIFDTGDPDIVAIVTDSWALEPENHVVINNKCFTVRSIIMGLSDECVCVIRPSDDLTTKRSKLL